MTITNSVRLDILLTLQQQFEAMTEQADGLVFSTVALGPLGAPDHTKRLSLGIVTGTEQKKYVSRAINASLPIDFEFRITVNQGDPSPAVLGERTLTVLQNKLLGLNDLNELIMAITEVSNQIDLEVYGDRTVMGVIRTLVQYRHNERDVTQQTLSA